MTTPGRPEIDWPCDFPTPHPPHEAGAYDDMGRLMGYTEHCHGGTEAASPGDEGCNEYGHLMSLHLTTGCSLAAAPNESEGKR